MATPKIIADFETSLATAVAIGGTSFTLTSATDDDGVALPAGLYYFTVDNGSTQKEYVACTLSGTSCTAALTVSRQGTETSGFARAHRVGASVIMTDFATYKKYMDGISLVSAPDASTSVKGVVEMATSAEINTGTAIGGTGALLSIAPDTLLASNYGTRLPSAAEKTALSGIENRPVYGGDGSDGVLNVTSGTTTIDLSSKSVWQYSSITVAVGATLTFAGGTVGDKVPALKCQGNFSNAGTITTSGLGPAGGAGGASCSSASCVSGAGTDGTVTVFPFVDGTIPGKGIKGGSATANNGGGTGGAGGTGGTAAPKNAGYFYPYALNGSGGAGGSGGTWANVGTPGNGSAGGVGSLGLILEISGNFSNTGTINLSGGNGTAGVAGTGNGSNSWGSGAGGGGGGGGAGSLVVFYKGTYTNSGTATVTGGTAGAGGAVTNLGATGGAPNYGTGGAGGSGGATSFNAGVVGTSGQGSVSSPIGGAGGAGGDGIKYFEKKS